MDNRRRLIRLNAGDFLEIRALDDPQRVYKAKVKDLTMMGVCFSCDIQWQKGQVLLIDYFIPDELDSVKIKMAVSWSEFIDPENGYFCGGEIIDIEAAKEDTFASYYYQKLKERFF